MLIEIPPPSYRLVVPDETIDFYNDNSSANYVKIIPISETYLKPINPAQSND